MKVKKKKPASFYILGYPPSGSYYKSGNLEFFTFEICRIWAIYEKSFV